MQRPFWLGATADVLERSDPTRCVPVGSVAIDGSLCLRDGEASRCTGKEKGGMREFAPTEAGLAGLDPRFDGLVCSLTQSPTRTAQYTELGYKV